MKYLPQIKLEAENIPWQGIDENDNVSFWRLERQKCDNWHEAIRRINKHPNLQSRVILQVSFKFWLIVNVI